MMRMTTIQHNGHTIKFLALNEVADYVEALEDGFMDDEDEMELFRVIFPAGEEYVRAQITQQLQWQQVGSHRGNS